MNAWGRGYWGAEDRGQWTVDGSSEIGSTKIPTQDTSVLTEDHERSKLELGESEPQTRDSVLEPFRILS